jgi:hypothetical protein
MTSTATRFLAPKTKMTKDEFFDFCHLADRRNKRLKLDKNEQITMSEPIGNNTFNL